MIPNESSAHEPRTPSEQPGEDRLRLLLSTGDDQGERDALRLGLQQAVGALAGLGGLVHLRGGQARGGIPLRLATSIGLPRNLTRAWVYLADHDSTAPGRATAENTRLWLPTTAVTPGPFPPRSGVAAVPLPGPEGPLGALSGVTAGGLPPTDGQWDLLERIAAWVGDRLGRPEPAEPGRRWRLAERRPGTRPPPSDEGGRGLQLVAALCQRWGTRYTPYGKSIWTEQAIPGPGV